MPLLDDRIWLRRLIPHAAFCCWNIALLPTNGYTPRAHTHHICLINCFQLPQQRHYRTRRIPRRSLRCFVLRREEHIFSLCPFAGAPPRRQPQGSEFIWATSRLIRSRPSGKGIKLESECARPLATADGDFCISFFCETLIPGKINSRETFITIWQGITRSDRGEKVTWIYKRSEARIWAWILFMEKFHKNVFLVRFYIFCYFDAI